MWILTAVIGYLLGSIPFGYVVGKAKGIDIRQHGSGNVGFTNVWRTLGIQYGLIVLLGDGWKGWMSAFFGYMLAGESGVLIGSFMAVMGHMFSCFLKFKGGKGIATGGGVLLFMSPITLAILLTEVALVCLITRYMSLASILAAWLAPVLLYYFGAPNSYVIGIGVAAMVVIIRHIPNIKRLMNGTENKLGHKKKPEASAEGSTEQ
ncbi:MAG: glycerol-3-phosphate 1-O-acyltransferase PlsY [Peptococcaceae bacterium]|jgi:glycerol-3-phosphate acyltransferase PlsY|nr:glycerol-3-phosphate 1-O-acyltransferase PlsY [Peptococcaceae bacterium]MBQ2448653.1 glycerol-3-phosphate 1-O-acyltransferase PlsY [Peptococcaceae bacterium]MBQ5652497.1 glycerol-3-phosphate 1-O-acyltransferase PlsY [Peptococcaceae bacterium]MBQ5683315.1 glycerol-3-phosphate 1-O-acyltransferase PlsY [Peptococcaceae bacterium]